MDPMGGPMSSPTTRGSGRQENEEAPATVRELPPGLPPGLPRIGELVAGRYRVDRLVGSGGMAHVLAARHIELGHAVAMKVLDPSLESDADAKERFAREARAMAALSSKHTVRVHDVGALATGLPFMVMELLEGKDLSQLLAARGPLPFDEACSYIAQACEAVEEAHDAGLDPSRPQAAESLSRERSRRPAHHPRARLRDCAHRRGAHRQAPDDHPDGRFRRDTLVHGTRSKSGGSRSVDERTDIWALGACLYRLVGGKHPFVAVPRGGARRGDPRRPADADHAASLRRPGGARERDPPLPPQGSGGALPDRALAPERPRGGPRDHGRRALHGDDGAVAANQRACAWA